MLEFIWIGWQIIQFFMFKVKMTKMPLLINLWASWPIVNLSQIFTQIIKFIFYVKINFSNQCSKFWLSVTAINPYFDQKRFDYDNF